MWPRLILAYRLEILNISFSSITLHCSGDAEAGGSDEGSDSGVYAPGEGIRAERLGVLPTGVLPLGVLGGAGDEGSRAQRGDAFQLFSDLFFSSLISQKGLDLLVSRRPPCAGLHAGAAATASPTEDVINTVHHWCCSSGSCNIMGSHYGTLKECPV